MPITDEERRKCADNALKCYGTAYIFEKKAWKFRWYIKLLAFSGIAVPASLGAVLGLIGTNSPWLPLAIGIAGTLGILQLILSIWSLASGWQDSFSYALESKSANYRLSDDFYELSATQSLKVGEFRAELRAAEAEASGRKTNDEKHDASRKEKAMGMRAGLWRYGRPCGTCNKVPDSLEPTSCKTCGDF